MLNKKMPKLTIEELVELMQDTKNECLEHKDCRDPLCSGYSSVVLCSEFHSFNSDMEKRAFYKQYGLHYEEQNGKPKQD